jgi:diguanylate cyclase (GGDEF)-like protein
MVHRMSRLLSMATGLPRVSDIIVHHMARAVGARLAALAVPDASGRWLSIVASYGYARGRVDHVRTDPGVEVLGQVFKAARAVHMRGCRLAGGWPRRLRYRTDSLVAVPILGRQDVVGVVSVTDRVDDQPFTREDWSVLRAFAAPAALALERERAVTDAETYAHAAAVDPLSGAFNRRYFHQRLDEELQRSRRHDIPVALLMIDVDDFKSVNDAFGHLAGDAIIREVADILRRSVRVFDVCTRFGGDEFAIVMPGSGAESARAIAERIRERIDSFRSQDPALAQSRVTVSIGLATSLPVMSGRDLVECADRALYLAKRGGKNQVRTITPNDEVQLVPRDPCEVGEPGAPGEAGAPGQPDELGGAAPRL